MKEGKASTTTPDRNPAVREFLETEEKLQRILQLFAPDGAVSQVLFVESKKMSLTSAEKQNLQQLQRAVNTMGRLATVHQKFLAAYKEIGFRNDSSEKRDELNAQYANFIHAVTHYVQIFENDKIPTISGQLAKTLDDQVKAANSGQLVLSYLMIKPVQALAQYALKTKEILKQEADFNTSNPQLPVDTKLIEGVQHFMKMDALNKNTNEQMRVPDQRDMEKTTDLRVTVDTKPMPNARENALLLLKETDAQVLKDRLKLPAGWSVNPKNKSAQANKFIIENSTGAPVFKINIYQDYFSIKQISNEKLMRTDFLNQLELNHQIVKALLRQTAITVPAQIHSKDADVITKMIEIGDNDKPQAIHYDLSDREVKVLAAQRSKLKKLLGEGKKPTTAIRFSDVGGQTITVRYQGSKNKALNPYAGTIAQQDNIDVANNFQHIIDQGFIPVLENQAGTLVALKNQGDFSGEIFIRSGDPLIAIKQYESVLAAGFTPILEEENKKKVHAYLRQTLQKSTNPANEKHLQVTALPNQEKLPDAHAMLKKINKATQDGFIVELDALAKQSLKAACSADARTGELAINMPDNIEPTLLLRNLLEVGLMPKLPADLRSLRQSINKGKNLLPIKIDSGNSQRDFELLETCFDKLGMVVEIANYNGMQEILAKGTLKTIDLTKLDSKVQIEQAKKLALAGIACRINPHLKIIDPNVVIASQNLQHAQAIYQNLVNSGFNPKFNSDTLALIQGGSKEHAPKFELGNVTEPEILFARIKECTAKGFMPHLASDPNVAQKQQKNLQQYIKNNKNLALEFSAVTPNAIAEFNRFVDAIDSNHIIQLKRSMVRPKASSELKATSQLSPTAVTQTQVAKPVPILHYTQNRKIPAPPQLKFDKPISVPKKTGVPSPILVNKQSKLISATEQKNGKDKFPPPKNKPGI